MAQTTVPSAAAPAGTFRVGVVLSRTFSLFPRTVAKFIVVSAAASLPTIAFMGGESTTNPDVRTIVTALVAVIVALFLNALSQAAILYGAFQEMRRRPVSLMESLAKGLTRFLPVIGVSICLAFGIMIGFILLIVPGIIFWIMWSVATPVCVVERRGPISSMSRSQELTKGYRWAIFGVILLVTIAGGIVQKGLEMLLMATVGGVPAVVVLWVWQALFVLFEAILVIVIYHDLRVAKEGVDVEQIASVFD
jgi:uncharacterized membrane protein